MSLVVRPIAGKGSGLVTQNEIGQGQMVFRFQGYPVPLIEASPCALQIDYNTAFESGANRAFENNLNHSCDPNCYVSMTSTGLCLIARRDIPPWEEITFDYRTTEHDLKSQGTDFDCSCGSPNCCRWVGGFVYLWPEDVEKIKPLLLPYLRA